MKNLRHVFAIVPDCHAPTGHYRALWQRHFYDGLRAVAERLVTPEQVDFSWARQWGRPDSTALQSPRDEASEQVRTQIERAHQDHPLDAVISYCFGHDLNPGMVQAVIRRGIPWINFYCDSTHRFADVESLARVVSLNWFVEHAAIPSYRALGVPSVCLPYALNPDQLPDCTNQECLRPVVFIGMPTANRITQLGWLRLLGCPVEVRGHGWIGATDDPFGTAQPVARRLKRFLLTRGMGEKILRRLFWPFVRPLAQGPLADAALAGYLRGSLAVLGLNQGRDAQGRLSSYLKFRDVEFAGYGCCYLTEHNEDVTAAFDVGQEILTFQTVREAAAQVRALGKDPAAARRIGMAGRRRVLAEHTWAVRLQQLAAAF